MLVYAVNFRFYSKNKLAGETWANMTFFAYLVLPRNVHERHRAVNKFFLRAICQPCDFIPDCLGFVYLLSEYYSSIQKRRNQVVDQQMNLGSIVLLEVVIHLQPLHHTTGQHTVSLPPLIILR